MRHVRVNASGTNSVKVSSTGISKHLMVLGFKVGRPGSKILDICDSFVNINTSVEKGIFMEEKT